MPSESNPPLQPNPFTTYRDPQTGIWMVAQSSDSSSLSGKERKDRQTASA